MSFNRLSYDNNTYKQDLYQSTETGRYQLLSDATYRNNDTCFQNTPEIHANNRQFRISKRNDMVNIESDLTNRIRKDSKDPRTKFPYTKVSYANPPSIASCTRTDLSRSYPTLDGSQWNREKQIQVPRFESLCLNPQQISRIRSNNYVGLNTRLYNRDQYQEDMPKVKGVTGLPNQAESKQYSSPLKRNFSTLIAQADQIAQVQSGSMGYKQYDQRPAQQSQKSGSKEEFCGSCSMAGARRR